MPTFAEVFNTAVTHHQAGRLAEAETMYRQVLASSPTHTDAWQLLGTVHYQLGRYQEAVDHIRRALDLGLRHPGVLNNLGAAYRALGRDAEAIATLQEALQLDPKHTGAWNNLGNCLKHCRKLDEAQHAYQRAIELDPNFADAHDNLGRLFQERGQIDPAIHHYRQTLVLKPQNPRSHNNLGTLLLARGFIPEALRCFDTAIVQQPNYARAWNNRGTALRELGQLSDAEVAFRRAVEFEPTLVEAGNNLGGTLGAQGRNAEAVQVLQQVVDIDPKNAWWHSNYLMELQYQPGITLAALADAHRQWDERHGIPLRAERIFWPQSRDPERRLRIGFISADFGRHPVGCIMLPLVQNLATDHFETVCYSNRRMHDPIHLQLRQMVAIWRDVEQLSDDQLWSRIREDRVDILFDLSGHTGHNRLSVFAGRAAPVQVTWAGYQSTTGLSAIEYLLTDEHMVPPGSEQHYREQVVRLPYSAWCCAIVNPPVDSGPPPAMTRGQVTFASFNNASKISPVVVELWARVMHAVPNSRLILKYRGFDDPGVMSHFRSLFASQGIDSGRVEFRGQTPFDQMLAEYREIDIALDPFPFGGGMTSLIALWMGVPVVTLPGETIASRQTLSMLANAGCLDTVAKTPEEYVTIAVRLAGDLPRLAAERQAWRERIARTAFLDPAKFVPSWSTSVRGLWRTWCAQEAP